MKDYSDPRIILKDSQLDSSTLAQAVYATMSRRGTPQPTGTPLGLRQQFATDMQKNSMERLREAQQAERRFSWGNGLLSEN